MAVEILPGNRLTLLRSGVEYFPALEAAIREARREVFIETYIYAGDATGERITRALCGAARRGRAPAGVPPGGVALPLPAGPAAAHAPQDRGGRRTRRLRRRNQHHRRHGHAAAGSPALRLRREDRGAAARGDPGLGRAPVEPHRAGEARARLSRQPL